MAAGYDMNEQRRSARPDFRDLAGYLFPLCNMQSSEGRIGNRFLFELMTNNKKRNAFIAITMGNTLLTSDLLSTTRRTGGRRERLAGADLK
jgi:hypothetical protein